MSSEMEKQTETTNVNQVEHGNGQGSLPKRKPAYDFFKRAFDITVSFLVLTIFSWLYLILAIAVKCSDGGSVFYGHPRVGKNGKQIKVYKFRSMKMNADRLQDILTPEEYARYLVEFKLDNDPRVTKIGKFLRKTSLDELPQFWDVFVGKISFVGPRPLMESEVNDKYGEDKEKLLSVKPGIVGWWAVNGRNNATYESGERQRLELYYVENRSAKLDLKIIFKAFGAVFKRDGAK